MSYLLSIPLLVMYFIWGLLLSSQRQRPIKKRYLYSALVSSYLLLCGPLANLAIAPLEFAYPAQHQVKAEHIVVMGCYHYQGSHLPLSDQLNDCSRTRVIEARRLWQQNPSAIIHLSGDIPSLKRRHVEVEREFLVALGVPDSQLRLYPNATNTQQEAEVVSNALRDSNARQVVLVTSANHMLRAKRWFDHYGQPVTPAPSHYQVQANFADFTLSDLLPTFSAVDTWRLAQYEYAALVKQQFQLQTD